LSILVRYFTLLLFLFLYILLSTLFIIFSLLVNKAKFAGVIGFITAIAMTIVGIVANSYDTTAGLKLFLSISFPFLFLFLFLFLFFSFFDCRQLFSPAAMVFANSGLIASEKAAVGTNTSNLSTKWLSDTPSVGYVFNEE
jgi:hypothetical protein